MLTRLADLLGPTSSFELIEGNVAGHWKVAFLMQRNPDFTTGIDGRYDSPFVNPDEMPNAPYNFRLAMRCRNVVRRSHAAAHRKKARAYNNGLAA